MQANGYLITETDCRDSVVSENSNEPIPVCFKVRNAWVSLRVTAPKVIESNEDSIFQTLRGGLCCR